MEGSYSLTRNSILCGMILLAGAVNVSFAGRIRMTDGLGGLNGYDASGGAFTANEINPANGLMGGVGGSATSFATFCIERNEHISFGSSYWTKIDNGAVNGGFSGQTTPNFDPISSATALLYQTFRASSSIAGLPVITTVNTTANRKLASSLQYAIWRLEGELNSAYNNPDGSNSGVNKDSVVLQDADKMYNWAVSNANGSLYGVRVLQLYTGFNATTETYSGNSQDQLTLVVPTPTAALGGATLAGMVVYVSRSRRRQELP
jgi:hypothetical protein